MVIEKWGEIAPGYNVQKAILKMTGIDFGPLRTPQANMPADMERKLGTAMKNLGVNITVEYVNWDDLTDEAKASYQNHELTFIH